MLDLYMNLISSVSLTEGMAALFIITFAFWLTFNVAFNMYVRFERMPILVKIPCAIFMLWFLWWDIVYNLVIASAVFLDPPRLKSYEYGGVRVTFLETFSARLGRYRSDILRGSNKWKGFQLKAIRSSIRIIKRVDPHHFD